MPKFPRTMATPWLVRSTDILDRTRRQEIANGILLIGETDDDLFFARYSPTLPHRVFFFTVRRHFMDHRILVTTQIHTFMRPLCFLQVTGGLPNPNLEAHVSSLVLYYLDYAGFVPRQNGRDHPLRVDQVPAREYILHNPDFLAWWHHDDQLARRVGDILAAHLPEAQLLELTPQDRELVREAQQVHGQGTGQNMNPHRYLAQQAQRAQPVQRTQQAQQALRQTLQQAQQVHGQYANLGQNTYHAQQQQQRAARGPAVQNPVAPRANNAAGATQPGEERRPVPNGQVMQVYNGPVPPSPFHAANVARGLRPGAGRNLHIDPRNDVNSLPNALRNAIRVRHGNPIERRGNVNVQNAAALGGRSNPIDLRGNDDVQNAPVAETAGVQAQPERTFPPAQPLVEMGFDPELAIARAFELHRRRGIDDVQNAPAAETPGVQAPPKCIFPLAHPLFKPKTAAEHAAERAAAWAASKRATEDAFELLRKRLAKAAAEHVDSVYESIAKHVSTSTSRPLPAVRPNPKPSRSKHASRVQKLKASGKSKIGYVYRINRGLEWTAFKDLKQKLATQEQSEKNLDGLPNGAISAAAGDNQASNSPRHGSVSSEVSVADLYTDSSTPSSPMATTPQAPVPSAQLDNNQGSNNLRVGGNDDDQDPDELYTEPSPRPSATATASEAPAPSSPPAQNGNRPDSNAIPDVDPRALSHAEQVAAARLNGSTNEDIEAAEILLSLGMGPVVFKY